MNPTPEQEAIFSAIRSTDDSLMVRAGAGCGKTSTSVMAASEIRKGRVGVAAFNKHIAEEMKQKLPRHVSAGTVHGFGFQIIRRCAGGEVKFGKEKESAGSSWNDTRI